MGLKFVITTLLILFILFVASYIFVKLPIGSKEYFEGKGKYREIVCQMMGGEMKNNTPKNIMPAEYSLACRF